MAEAADHDILLRAAPPVVGVGASAGGLEALRELLKNLPDQHKFAIVIIQHLDPDHDSLMPELLSKDTATPVRTAEDGMSVEPGHVYLIGAGHDLTIENGHLRTHKFDTPRGLRRPIDKFFTSLAEDVGLNAVGIILSGTGSDGAAGIKAVKEHSGLVFVQDPDEAKYDGMPRSAVETGVFDLILPAGEMFDVLNDYFVRMGGIEPDRLTDKQFIERAMKHVRFRTGHDFTSYKPATLLRRIAVRMSVLGVEDPKDYLKLLIDTPDEADRLFRDVLINVTSFFRNPETWQRLKESVIPALLDGKGSGDEIRVWVSGCSTGQEAYTIGILLLEEVERLSVKPRISIFATDIDNEALRVGRAGIYPDSIAMEVPEDLLSKYFDARAAGFEVRTELRDVVRFSNQSLIKDPPFSRIDLLSCRNLLIYFDQDLQDVAINVFHYSLREGGYLLLGNSESPTQAEDKFEVIDRRHRILKRGRGPAVRVDLRAPRHRESRPVAPPSPDAGDETTPHDYVNALATDFAPPFLVINRHREIIFSSDEATRYLQFRSGEPKLDITKVVHSALDPSIRRLMNKALAPGEIQTVTFDGTFEGEKLRLDLSRKRIDDNRELLVFRQFLTPTAEASEERDTQTEEAPVGYIRELEDELDEARETIRTTVEELETSNEELKSSNEEMMSMNEELQSANEELRTTNDELNAKIAEVRQINTDLSNFIHSTQIATVFLNDDLTLRSFTPEATKIFRFNEKDRNRPIHDLGSSIDVEALVADCQKVTDTRTTLETEYTTRDGLKTYHARIIPYDGGADQADEGVVFTLIDVTELRRLAQESLEQAEIARHALAEVEQIYQSSPQAMGMIDPEMRFMRVNRELAEINGIPIDAHIGVRVDEIVPDLNERVLAPIRQVMATHEPISNLRVIGQTPGSDGENRIFEADWFPVFDGDNFVGTGVNVRDITDKERMAFELRRVMQELQHRVKNMLANVQALISRARRDATTDKEVFEALSRRVQALSQTHKLLTEKNWGSAKLRGVIGPELLDVYGKDRVTLRGPEIDVNARSALSFGMTVHELATNAAKYGAFSVPGGHVTFSWIRQDDGERDQFVFTWKERGGPTPPTETKSGFGTQLIKSTIEGSLCGEVETRWEPEGLVCVMSIPAIVLTEIVDEAAFDVLAT